MIITTLGPSPQAPQAGGTLDIENIIVTTENLQPAPSRALAVSVFNRNVLTVVFAWVVWFAISNHVNRL